MLLIYPYSTFADCYYLCMVSCLSIEWSILRCQSRESEIEIENDFAVLDFFVDMNSQWQPYSTVALTHDHHPLKKGRYAYSDTFGLLTLLINNKLHKVQHVVGSCRAFAFLICRKLGQPNGFVIEGPWLNLYRRRFSRLTTWCDESRIVENCFDVQQTSEIKGYVDYVICMNHTKPVSWEKLVFLHLRSSISAHLAPHFVQWKQKLNLQSM